VSYQIHPQAGTTPLVRKAIQTSTQSQRDMAVTYGISRQTISKWQNRDSVEDKSHCPHRLQTRRAQNELPPEQVDNIHRWYAGYQDVAGICRVVTLDEIRENDFNLNIPRYVEPVIEEASMTIDQAIANLQESLQAAHAAKDRLKGLLLREGLLFPKACHRRVRKTQEGMTCKP
jgi:transposase